MDVYVYDNGISNLKSMVSAIEYTGNNPIITTDCKVSKKINHMILPGVGSFDAAMRQMQKNSNILGKREFWGRGVSRLRGFQLVS